MFGEPTHNGEPIKKPNVHHKRLWRKFAKHKVSFKISPLGGKL